jgi:hypothetical protein
MRPWNWRDAGIWRALGVLAVCVALTVGAGALAELVMPGVV